MRGILGCRRDGFTKPPDRTSVMLQLARHDLPSAAGRCDARAQNRCSRKEDLMYAAIRQAKAKAGTAEELARRIKEGAIPIISDVDGFKAYYVVYAGDDTVTAISVFNNFASAEEANRRALAWIDENLGPLLVGQVSAVAGPVIVHTLA